MKIKTKTLYLAIIIILAFSSGSVVEHMYHTLIEKSSPIKETEIHRDTLILTNVISDTVLMPVYGYIHRIDTVVFRTPADTVEIPVLVPIERKTYKTEDYRAVIEGWNPSLLEMEVYQKTQYITNTVTKFQTVKVKPRFGVGIQTGYGFNGKSISPYVGIGFQYNLFTF